MTVNSFVRGCLQPIKLIEEWGNSLHVKDTVCLLVNVCETSGESPLEFVKDYQLIGPSSELWLW